MGRSTPTYRDRLGRTRESWSDFRRALRRADRPAYDALWTAADRYADAAGYHDPARPLDAVLLSVALAHQRRLAELEARLEKLEDQRDGWERDDESRQEPDDEPGREPDDEPGRESDGECRRGSESGPSREPRDRPDQGAGGGPDRTADRRPGGEG